MKILAVDDDAFGLEVLHGLAARAGYPDIVTSQRAGAAPELITAAQLPFQCTLLDIQMPGMNGVEFCDLQRRLPDFSECPITMVTAMTDRKFVDQAYPAGATDYVVEPFAVDDLKSRLGLAARSLK